jgi:hypothetical protein
MDQKVQKVIKVSRVILADQWDLKGHLVKMEQMARLGLSDLLARKAIKVPRVIQVQLVLWDPKARRVFQARLALTASMAQMVQKAQWALRAQKVPKVIKVTLV